MAIIRTFFLIFFEYDSTLNAKLVNFHRVLITLSLLSNLTLVGIYKFNISNIDFLTYLIYPLENFLSIRIFSHLQ